MVPSRSVARRLEGNVYCFVCGSHCMLPCVGRSCSVGRPAVVRPCVCVAVPVSDVDDAGGESPVTPWYRYSSTLITIESILYYYPGIDKHEVLSISTSVGGTI